MTFVGCFFFVSPTQAQGGPQEVGAWSYLRDQNQVVVVWRQSMNPSWDQAMAPPGWYMLFLVSHDGVPSETQWVRLKLADCYAPEGSAMRISFEDLSSSLSAEQKESWERSPLTVEFRDPETGTVESSYTLSLPAPDEQGQWSWTVPADGSSGLYELYVTSYRSWLGHRQIVDGTSARRVTVSLRNGDVNGDNGVDALDLEIAMSQMGAMDSAGDQVLSGDVNADGVVDSQDIDIILANIGAMGAR
ncbi:MAG: DUF1929 domain-containing protein [Fimbriimonadia bacterium]|nr:DUF1929 domain-containing protein [Phycisphaeraceae bacterium]MCW5935379.1 DUF1929 domain-containing protein [Fimbriimonadia bacterium]